MKYIPSAHCQCRICRQDRRTWRDWPVRQWVRFTVDLVWTAFVVVFAIYIIVLIVR